MTLAVEGLDGDFGRCLKDKTSCDPLQLYHSVHQGVNKVYMIVIHLTPRLWKRKKIIGLLKIAII